MAKGKDSKPAKGGAADKGGKGDSKSKKGGKGGGSKGDAEDSGKAAKVKGAMSINVRHILVSPLLAPLCVRPANT